ncbi:MAG: type VI secretion system tip protein TssI/VgrG, partial [Rhodospirillaceae bacterium]
SADCRIFQAMTAPEIIKKVCSDQGFTDLKDTLQGTYTARDYCVQYRETDYAFIRRLMAEEGMFFFFTFADGVHTLVLADDSSAHEACTVATVHYDRAHGADLRGDGVTSFSVEHRVTSGTWAARDYDFENPSTDLTVSVDGADTLALPVYTWPGLYLTKDAGEALAKKRIEALELPAKLALGGSACAALTAGGKVTLADHPRDDLNIDWALWEVSHALTQSSYSNTFTGFPADTPFRLAVEDKPRIPGTQTAVVVGKSGDEICTDTYGRIKVQFHWDRLGKNDENSSCWVRVAQGWAGKGWGMMFLPRVGQEVVVSFLDGDPDRPLITGSVYNAEQTVPYTLPDDMTKSTLKTNSSKDGSGNYNELRFEDKKDSEEVYLQAEKDMTVLVKNQRATTVDKADDTLTLNEGSRTTTITKGDDTLTVSEGKRTVSVNSDESLTVEGKRTLAVTGAEEHTNKDAFTHTVAGDYTLTVDGDLTIKAASITIKTTSGDYALASAGAIAEKATGDVSIKATGALNTESSMSATHKGSMGLTMDGGLSLTGKGTSISIKADATVSVEGGAMGTFKGAMTKIG